MSTDVDIYFMYFICGARTHLTIQQICLHTCSWMRQWKAQSTMHAHAAVY